MKYELSPIQLSEDDKPLIKWFDEFEKLLKRAGGSYSKVKPTDMLKLYYKKVSPKDAVKQLKEHQGHLMPKLSGLPGPRPFMERELTKGEVKKKEKIGKNQLPKSEFKKRYDPPPHGPAKTWQNVLWATATKRAKGEK